MISINAYQEITVVIVAKPELCLPKLLNCYLFFSNIFTPA